VSTPHSSRFASLAFGAFYFAVPFLTFYEFIKVGNPWKTGKTNSERMGIRATDYKVLKRRDNGVPFSNMEGFAGSSGARANPPGFVLKNVPLGRIMGNNKGKSGWRSCSKRIISL
jgi:hypothetical protein